MSIYSQADDGFVRKIIGRKASAAAIIITHWYTLAVVYVRENGGVSFLNNKNLSFIEIWIAFNGNNNNNFMPLHVIWVHHPFYVRLLARPVWETLGDNLQWLPCSFEWSLATFSPASRTLSGAESQCYLSALQDMQHSKSKTLDEIYRVLVESTASLDSIKNFVLWKLISKIAARVKLISFNEACINALTRRRNISNWKVKKIRAPSSLASEISITSSSITVGYSKYSLSVHCFKREPRRDATIGGHGHGAKRRNSKIFSSNLFFSSLSCLFLFCCYYYFLLWEAIKKFLC